MSDEQYTNLSNIRTEGKVIADEQVETPVVKANTVIADEIKKNDGKEYALKEYVDTEVSRKTDKEVNTSGGISRISNMAGDEGGCITFTHNDLSKSGIGVNNGGLNGLTAQIYSVDGSNLGTRINVTQQKIYYTKKSDATYSDIDEIATMRDIHDTDAVWGKITGNLDDQTDLKTKLDAMDTATINLDVKVNNEVGRSTTEDTRLLNLITGETNRATQKETELNVKIDTSISTEKSRAEAKENELSVAVNQKVQSELSSVKGKSRVFNETSGGGTKFEFATGSKSYVGVNDDESGVMAQIYALDASNTGTRINVNKNKIYYTKGKNTPAVTDAEELATVGDVQKLSGTFRGNFNTHADLLAYSGEKYKNDYAIVNKDETHWDQVSRYSYSGSVWEFEYSVSSDFIKTLPKEEGSGQDYRFPYHFDMPVQNPDNITTKFYTLVLNDGVTKNEYPIIIPSADIANNKAGLYTQGLANLKADATTVTALQSTVTTHGTTLTAHDTKLNQLAGDIVNVTAKVNDEEARAKAKENELATNLEEESARAMSKETEIATSVAMETTDRTTADAKLANDIMTEKARAEGMEATKLDISAIITNDEIDALFGGW